MKILILLLITFFSFNLQANYEKKQVIIDGNEIIYSESTSKYLHDSIFKLNEKQDTEILYFFSYNCTSCYAFKDYFIQAEDILKEKENVRIEKIPLFIEKDSISYYNAELFFWRKILKFNKDFDSIIFDLIHKEKVSIQSKKDIKRLLVNYALIEEEYINNPKNNLKLKYRLEKSQEIAKELKVATTPTIIIHKKGKRYIINATDSGKPFNMLLALLYILEYK